MSLLTLDIEKAAAGGRMLARHEGRVVLVPDLREDGTNVISLPSASGFRFGYGFPTGPDRILTSGLRRSFAT